MAYDYKTQRPKLFTDAGIEMLMTIKDTSKKLLDVAGAARLDRMIRRCSGDSWTMLACVDYLVERGEIREVTTGHVAGQDRVFVSTGVL